MQEHRERERQQSRLTSVTDQAHHQQAYLLIAADGARSTLRSLIFPDSRGEASNAPYHAINTTLSGLRAAYAESLHASNKTWRMGVHPRGEWYRLSIVDVPSTDASTWIYQVEATRRCNASEPMELPAFKERMKDIAEPFRSAFAWLPYGTRRSQNQPATWVTQQWDMKGGHVVLAGDSAHPIMFHRGQGLSRGILNAGNLVSAICKAVGRGPGREDGHGQEQDEREKDKNVDWEVAITAYRAEVVARRAEEVQNSLQTPAL